RVYRMGDTLPVVTAATEPVVALLRNQDDGYDGSLLVPAGRKVPNLDFAKQNYPFRIDILDVPDQLILLAYSGRNYQGEHSVVSPGIYNVGLFDRTSAIGSMQSFRVIRAADVAMLSNKTIPPAVLGYYTTRFCTSDNITFALGQEYMTLPNLEWDTLHIPDGLALVMYDRPWLLGRYVVWTAPLVQSPRSLGNRFRSAKVVLLDDAPPPQLDPLPPIVRGGFSEFLQVGEVEPALSVWEHNSIYCTKQSPLSTKLNVGFDRMSVPGLVLTAYNDYNFQGNSLVHHQNSNSKSLWRAYPKSYTLLPENSTVVPTTLFAGIYPNRFGFDIPPIFMQVGDSIASLDYPWNADIQNVTVPSGLTLLTYSGEHFQGNCKEWTGDTCVDEPWNTSIMSLRVVGNDAASTTPCKEAAIS
ncbi:hypothetical protein As57867_006891, partial [Aphanomyces stellatus]